MKILLYNFVQPSDRVSGAGGVGIYLQGLLQEFQDRNIDVITLSSGTSYSPYSSEITLRTKKHEKYSSANVVNSPVIAPSYKNFFSPDVYLRDMRLSVIPYELLKKYGHIDVLHFHNIEGLTLDFFYNLRRVFPASRIYYSAHNYNIVCPQVNLWREERENCGDYRGGRACVSCMPFRDADYQKRIQASYWLRHDLARWPAFFTSKMLRRKNLPLVDTGHFGPETKTIIRNDLAEDFGEYRRSNAAMARAVFDRILAVSDRTRTVLINHGLDPGNICMSYIGSAQVGSPKKQARRSFDDVLNIAYLGYARRDKGFFFLMRALRMLPDHIAKRVSLTVAVKVGDNDPVLSAVARLTDRLHAVSFHNGYSSSDIPILLSGVSLGIIPSLWEDNLPQVAIEYVAQGIPILVSDLGGASEIGGNKAFIFTAGSIPSFTQALQRILDKELKLEDFWLEQPNIRSMSAHASELIELYTKDLLSKKP